MASGGDQRGDSGPGSEIAGVATRFHHATHGHWARGAQGLGVKANPEGFVIL